MSSLADPNPANDSRRLASAAAKRKLDDYAPAASDDDDFAADLLSIRMRKDELYSVQHPAFAPASSSSSGRVPWPLPHSPLPSSRLAFASRLQFFVRMISEGKTLVFQANSSDTVQSIHDRIQVITGIPVSEQRLIYRGKQLQCEKSLADCAIQNDAGLHLVGRMRSTGHPQAWQIIDDMISLVCRLCKGETVPYALKTIRTRISEYLSMTPKDDGDPATGHLQIFMSSSAPAALVMLYMSPIRGNKECADDSIRHFLDSCITELPKSLRSRCAPIVLEFCKLLRRLSSDDSLYLSCRSSLGSMLELIKVSWISEHSESVKRAISIQEIFPFVRELAERLSKDLELSLISAASVGTWSDVLDFTMFLRPLRTAISGHKGFKHPISLPLKKKHHDVLMCTEEVELLYPIYEEMLKKMNKCLFGMEERLSAKVSGEIDIAYPGWSRYLTILKELNAISKLYLGLEERFWTILSLRKRALCTLVVRYAKRSDDHKWLLEHKDIMDFESRRHLVMMMFPEVKEDFEEQHEMLIDRSQLLSESFEYIANAEAESLHGGIFMEFKNEEATGPGVLREWFVLVCQAIFNQQNPLFVACPNDRRRFYPNPASTVEPLHLKYFNFSGRMIGLALMHKVQVGIVLDRVFFLQLGGYSISLEDIRDADPYMYNSCKQILEMDAEFIDSDALGLTFVREVEELGLRRVVELCDGGKGMVVNSKNRNDYVDLLIKHRFVTSISQQVSHFAQGFGDILSELRLQKFFFQSLELEDIDQMLHGSENDISVEDWKAHTEYNGYKGSDPQIVWFWKIVSEMSPQQKKNILFFWTSVKYLPVEGFRGLASRLYIYKSTEHLSRLPSSHTCFYRLCFPPYPSMAIMQQRLSIIAQEHVGCSFGTW
ncbi:E3 ubiquitin-protein ligase UPL5 [Syzygium oleosum]|uniref:E3 ubiquitin-protein ligase UPL5 n=1 Tax=Syzygium oleosum TaxID=219896 RepID=UPI0024B927D2|nr:E3 ubiquitin-protein ligase UPL5 [Syzygium oleosum]